MSETKTTMQPAPRPGATTSNATRQVPLDDRWRQWIAENLLRDCTVASMLQTMAAAGLDRAESQRAVANMPADAAFLAARRIRQLQMKLESVMANQQKLWEISPSYLEITRRASISRDEFIERHVVASRPLVLTELAKDWPAMQRWSPHYLKERFGHVEVEIQAERQSDARFEENKQAHRRTMRMGDFADKVLAGGPTNDYYLTANNEVLRRGELAPLIEDIGTLPDYCDAPELSRAASFWFGPGGTNTPLHHDTLMLLHTQVVGRKRWRFISPMDTPKLYNHHGVYSPVDVDKPDLARFPKFGEVKVLEVTLNPGETIFLPLGWWHQVSSLEVSISFSFTNLAIPNTYTYFSPDIRDWD